MGVSIAGNDMVVRKATLALSNNNFQHVSWSESLLTTILEVMSTTLHAISYESHPCLQCIQTFHGGF